MVPRMMVKEYQLKTTPQFSSVPKRVSRKTVHKVPVMGNLAIGTNVGVGITTKRVSRVGFRKYLEWLVSRRSLFSLWGSPEWFSLRVQC